MRRSAFVMTAEPDCREVLLLRKHVSLCLDVSYPTH